MFAASGFADAQLIRMPRAAASESVDVVRFRSRSKRGSGGIADEHGLRLLGGIRLVLVDALQRGASEEDHEG